MSTDSEGWRQQMEALIGMSPLEPEVEDGRKKDRVPAGAPFTWIAANFVHCPEDANDEVIQTYARVYMWYVISRTIFADGTGKNAPWMWLKALTVFDNKFNWSSAALAYLYRHLDDACRRSTKDGGVGGCMLLLLIWSWERLPVGCPKAAKWNTWDDHGNPVRLPTWAYKWDVVSEVASDVNLLYKQYTNEMDSLTAEHVNISELTHNFCSYEEDILEEPTEYDALAHGEYNRLIREGYQTSFAPILNFVLKEVKKQDDETEAILDKTPGGKKGEFALRLFIKALCYYEDFADECNIRSGSFQRNTLDDSTSSGARMDDGDITSAAHLEDDVDTPEVADEMTLKAFQRSAYMLKPRKEFRRYSPDDYAHKGKNPVVGGSRLSRMRSMDDEDDDEDGDELDEPEPVVRRKKLASKRGRGPKM
ncbi:mutator protein [Hordeum vulgare]|nr:mutator protein [Hordeum vulgare]